MKSSTSSDTRRLRLFIVSESGRSTLLSVISTTRRRRQRSTRAKHDESHVVRQEPVGRGGDEEHARCRNPGNARSVGTLRRRGRREEAAQSTGVGRVKKFIRSLLFPSFSLFYSLDRAGDPLSEDDPAVKVKTPKNKANKKAAKELHERVIVRPNPPDSNPFLDLYASFYSSITGRKVTGSEELSFDGTTMDTHTPGPSTDTCKATTSHRLTQVHTRQQRILTTHITTNPSHNQGGEGSPSEVSSNPTKRNSLPHPHLSYHTMKVP